MFFGVIPLDSNRYRSVLYRQKKSSSFYDILHHLSKNEKCQNREKKVCLIHTLDRPITTSGLKLIQIASVNGITTSARSYDQRVLRLNSLDRIEDFIELVRLAVDGISSAAIIATTIDNSWTNVSKFRQQSMLINDHLINLYMAMAVSIC